MQGGLGFLTTYEGERLDLKLRGTATGTDFGAFFASGDFSFTAFAKEAIIGARIGVGGFPSAIAAIGDLAGVKAGHSCSSSCFGECTISEIEFGD